MREKELEYIYQKYYHSLFLYAFSLCKNRADAQDIVAETFLKAMVCYEDDITNVKAWLYIVLKNQFIDMYRKKKKVIEEDKYPMEWIEDSKNYIEEIFKDDQKRWMYKQIYALKDREREIMLMSLVMDMNDESIAKQLHLESGNVRIIRYRIKQKLIEKAKEEGYF